MESSRFLMSATAVWVVLLLAAAVLALIALCLILWLRLRKIESRYELLTRDTDGGSLANVLEEHLRRLHTEMDRVAELDVLVHEVERSGRSHLQRVGFLRFNPFRDVGGDQSFSIAMTDQDGNGVVLSSLHNREVTRVYAKALKRWESVHALTEEEHHVIGQARGESATRR